MEENGRFDRLTLEELQKNLNTSFNFMDNRIQQQQNMILEMKSILEDIADIGRKADGSKTQEDSFTVSELDLEQLKAKLWGTHCRKALLKTVSDFFGKFRKKSWESERQELIIEICQMPFDVEQMKILAIAVRSPLLSAADVRMIANPECDPERMYTALEFMAEIKD